MDKNRFYVYVYLDPRKPGDYKYKNYTFEFEPFYIGKGGTKRQFKRHLNESKKRTRNDLKYNKIQKIRKDNFEPIILIIKNGLIEFDALFLENELIKHFGRLNIKTGFLTNLIENSIGGRANPSKESRIKMENATRGKSYEEIYGIEKAKELKLKRIKSNKNREVSQKLIDNLTERNSKKWTVINPDGQIFNIKNLKLFCENNNLTTTLMWSVANNKQAHHKKWKCFKN